MIVCMIIVMAVWHVMKQQKTQRLPQPIKSLSARSFFKAPPPSTAEGRRCTTLHTQPATSNTKPIPSSKGQSKSVRQVVLRRQPSYVVPEQLYSQNLKLKGKINKMAEQLVQQRVKHKKDTQHFTQMKKQVEVQFQDDRYMDISKTQNKLIEGIKHQYHAMKLKYEDKCRELNEFIKRYEVSGGEEYRFMCEALEIDNKKLRDKFEVLLNTEQHILGRFHSMRQSGEEPFAMNRLEIQQQQEKVLQLLGYSTKFVMLQKKVENLQKKTMQQKFRISSLKGIIGEKEKKILFLDRLITEKANQNHQLIMRERKIVKEHKAVSAALEELQVELAETRERHEEQIAVAHEREKVKFQTERAIFANSLRDKDDEIEKLSSQLRYLSTIISYIKTGEDPLKAEQSFNPLSKKNSQKEHSQELLVTIEKSLQSLDGFNSPRMRQRVKTLFESGFKEQGNTIMAQVNSESLKIQISDEEENLVRSIRGSVNVGEEEEQEEQGLIESRIVKRSYFKHSTNHIKLKHVKLSQIEHLRQQLAFRFIHYRLTIDAAKDHLSYFPSPEDEAGYSRKERRWKGHYISMKEIRNKLGEYPFQLKENDALMFGRYIVEDATKDAVYYHEENEVERSIAKSIVRAFVGEYVLPEEEQARREIAEVLGKSGKNLNSALCSLAPTGTISALKLVQICRGIQVQFSEPALNFLLSQLAARSAGLLELNYGLMFSQQF